MGLLRRAPKRIEIPEASRFDRFDDQTLYSLVEQALGTAEFEFREAQSVNDETAFHLNSCDTALSDAQAGIRAALRRRLALAQNL